MVISVVAQNTTDFVFFTLYFQLVTRHNDPPQIQVQMKVVKQ